MTITIQPARNELTANAGQTIFNYTFKIFSITDLNVYITPAGQDANDSTDLTTAYTVSGVGISGGGSITLATPANLNDLVTIVSNVPSSRTTDYQNNGDFRPVTVNADFDRVVSIAKKVEDLTNRALLTPQSQQGPKPLFLPNPVAQALMRWKSDLTGLENVFFSDLSSTTVPNDLIVLNSTLAAVIADPNVAVGQVYILSDRADGIFDVVLSSGVTANEFNIIESTADPLISFVLRPKFYSAKAVGAKGDGDLVGSGSDDSTAILALFKLTNNPHFEDGIYNISYDVQSGNASFFTYTDQININITGKGATIYDKSVYGPLLLNNIIEFRRCVKVYSEINFDANELTDPTLPSPQGIGYEGSSGLYFRENCRGIKVVGSYDNLRYGVRSGDFSDPVKGNCKDFDINIDTFKCGYPVAMYLANDIKVNINANFTHRSSFFAGCTNVSGNVVSAGFTFATAVNLLTSSVTVNDVVDANRRARGCSNVRLNYTDNGSTGTTTNRALSSVAYQWTAPDTSFDDVEIGLYMKTTDANRTLGGFRLENDFTWFTSNQFTNFTLKGSIDRGDQTLGASSWADISIQGFTVGEASPYITAPEFINWKFDGLTILNAGITGNTNIIRVPNLIDNIILSKVHAVGGNFNFTARAGSVDLQNSTIGNISTGDKIERLNLSESVTGTITGDIKEYGNSLLTSAGFSKNTDGSVTQWFIANYNVTAGDQQTFNLPTTFDTAALNAVATTVGISGRTVAIDGITTTTLTLRASFSPVSIYVQVIGH